MKHAHLLIHCFETILCFMLSIFMPSVAIALSISEKYVPLFQSLAACGTIALVCYTFGKEFYKKGWFEAIFSFLTKIVFRMFLLIAFPLLHIFRKLICDLTFKELNQELWHDFKNW